MFCGNSRCGCGNDLEKKSAAEARRNKFNEEVLAETIARGRARVIEHATIDSTNTRNFYGMSRAKNGNALTMQNLQEKYAYMAFASASFRDKNIPPDVSPHFLLENT